MNRADYECELNELQAPPALRARIAALEEKRPVGRRRRTVRRLATAACLALAVGAAVWLLPKAPAAISDLIAALRSPDPVEVPTPTPEDAVPTPSPQGKGYSYTDAALGFKITVPEAWMEYFTFVSTGLPDAFQGDDGTTMDTHAVMLRPGAWHESISVFDRDLYEACAFAHICWVPDGMNWPTADTSDVDITLLDTAGGAYVCRLHPSVLAKLSSGGYDRYPVALRDLRYACEIVQTGLQNGLWQVEALHRPKLIPHVSIEGVAPNAEDVLPKAREYMEEDQLEAAHHYGTLDLDDYSFPVFDQLRISRLERCYQTDDLASGHIVELYCLDWALHSLAPERTEPLLAGHLSLTENGWFAPTEGTTYLLFLRAGENGRPVYYGAFFDPQLQPDDPKAFTEENIRKAVQQHLAVPSADAQWTVGEGYSYTSEALGIRVEFPPEWEKYFTFTEERRQDFLYNADDTSSDILTLTPKFSLEGCPLEDSAFGHIYWVPKGASGPEEYKPDNAFLVLAETDQGKYICTLNVQARVWLQPGAYLAELYPESAKMQPYYRTVLDGILFHDLWRTEVIHAPIPTPEPTPDPEDTYTYTNTELGFSMELPASWRDRVEIGDAEQFSDRPMLYEVMVYQKSARQWSPDHGWLFSIICWRPDTKLRYITEGAGGNVILFQTDEYIYGFHTPSGVEFNDNDPEMFREWQELSSQFEFVRQHIRLLSAPEESLYVSQDYGFTLRLPASWEGQYTVDRHVSPTGALCLDFYHLPSYQYTDDAGRRRGLLFSIVMEDTQGDTHTGGTALGTRWGTDFICCVPADASCVPKTAQSYRELFDSLSAVDIKSCFELDRDFSDNIPVPTAISDVLRGQGPFLYGEDRRFADLEDYPLLVGPYGPSVELQTFAVVDLDGDGTQEVVLWAAGVAGDTGRYLVLRREGPYVQSYEANYRMFADLKADGSFSYTDLAGTKEAIATVSFRGGEMVVADHAAAMAAQAKKRDVKWYDFTDANIQALFPVSTSDPQGIISEDVSTHDDVLAAAVEWVKGQYALYAENAGGMYRHPDAVYDNWRIDGIKICETYDDLLHDPYDKRIYVYHVSWRIHTTTPDLGGNLAGPITEDMEDGWFTPGYGCDYLVFLNSSPGNVSTLLFHLMENDCEPGSDTFNADVERALLERIPVPVPEGSAAEDIDVPDRVLYQAEIHAEKQYYLAHLPQTYGDGVTEDMTPDFDHWRIKSLEKCYEVNIDHLALGLGDVEVYRMDWALHTTTPDRASRLLAEGRSLDADGWFTPSHPNCTYLLFRDSSLISVIAAPECSPNDGTGRFEQLVVDQVMDDEYILEYIWCTIAGVEVGAPLEELPEELRAVLKPKGKPWEGTPWRTKDPAWSICQLYTAPGIEIITTKVPPEKLEGHLRNYRDDPAPESLESLLQEFGVSTLDELYRQEIDREYVTSVTLTGPEYATNAGLRVGMTEEEWSALYREFAGERNLITSAVMEASMSASLEGDVITEIEVHDMLGRRVGAFFDL